MSEVSPAEGTRFVCSWSGGKDSCLALWRAKSAGAVPAALLSMLHEDGARSRSHGIALGVLRAQSAALGLPLVTRVATWDGYEEAFVSALKELEGEGISEGVFGDIDLEDHRKWEERVCAEAGMVARLPLWQGDRRELFGEFLSLGFKAVIVTVRAEKLGKEFLGRELDDKICGEFEALGVDVCGENGEYHTVVTDGPLFSTPVEVEKGEVCERSGCWSLDLRMKS